MALPGPPVLAALVAAVLLRAALPGWLPRGGGGVQARLPGCPSGPGLALLGGCRVHYARAMRYRVLGPLEVDADNGPVTLGGQKERLLRPSC